MIMSPFEVTVLSLALSAAGTLPSANNRFLPPKALETKRLRIRALADLDHESNAGLVSGTSLSRLGIHIHDRCQHGRDELFFTRLDGKSISRAHSESLASALHRRACDE
jgi:hypothetical protein